MTITQMLGQSATLTVLGLGVVFSFLIILIISMMLIEKLVELFKLDQDEKQTGSSAVAGAVQGSANKTAVVAAIAAAIREKQNI